MSGPGARSISKEVIPYLKRINTQDYVDRVAEHSIDLRKPTGLKGCAMKILQIPGFDNFMGVVIVANLFVMIIETDRSANEDEASSNTTHWTDVFGWVALAIFVFELSVRLVAHRCGFWQDKGNVFDFHIVALDTIFSLIGLAAGNLFPVSILRIFRLAKLARVSKVLRVFPELKLLLAGLISSISAIFWGTLLLFLCLLVCSMVAVLFIHPLNKTVDYGDTCDRCPHAYSSVMQATLTFWQQIVTGDSWGQATIPVIEKYPATVLYFVPVFLIVGMAVMNLILGVVVSAAQMAKEELEEEERTEQALTKLQQQSELLKLCVNMDKDGSGELTYEEVKEGLQTQPEFKQHLDALNISEEDFEIAWAIMDADGSGTVSYKEFVNYLCTMRISDNHFMVAYIKYYITWIRRTLLDAMESQRQETEHLEAQVEEIAEEIEVREDNILEEESRILEVEARIFEENEAVRLSLGEITQAVSSGALLDNKTVGTGLRRPGLPQLDIDRLAAQAASARSRFPVQSSLEDLRNDEGAVVTKRSSACRGLHTAQPRIAAITVDEAQDWFQKICDDIKTMRSELKDVLMDMNRKLSQDNNLSTDVVKDLGYKLEVEQHFTAM